MARMHSRKKGKAKSKKPLNRTKPTWMRYKAKEAELLIVKLAKEGKGPSQIGISLRDVYGVPSSKTIIGKGVTKVLEERKLLSEIPEDLMALMKKGVMIKKHLEANHKDETAKRGLHLTESKIKRLVKYYKKNRKLPLDWRYRPEKMSLYLE